MWGGALTLVLCGAVVAALMFGAGEGRLRSEAVAAIDTFAGDAYVTSIGGTRLSFDGLDMLTVHVTGIRLTPQLADTGDLEIGSARFALRLLPLLRGEVRLGRMRIDDARIELAALTRTQGQPDLGLFDDAGRLDQDAVISAVFAGAQEMMALLDRRDVDRVRLRNVEFVDADPSGEVLSITDAVLRRAGEESFRLEGELSVFGRTLTIEGDMGRHVGSDLVDMLRLGVDMPMEAEASLDPAGGNRIGDLSVLLTGSQTSDTTQLDVSGQARGVDILFDHDRGERIVGDVQLSATLAAGSGKAEFDDLRVVTGRSEWRFHGALGAAPDPAAGYRFELVSDGSTVAPLDSPEPAFQVVARLAGHLDTSLTTIDLDEIGIRALDGDVQGRGRIDLLDGSSPGLRLELDVNDVGVGHAKQLWPWFAARGARNWVSANLFGGRVETGHLVVDAAPGRLTDGVPLGPEELHGHFKVNGTRFDVAGHIPAVRDAYGAVDFSGTKVDISLESGTVFMPGNRAVNASNGTLSIADAAHKPLIGDLKIDVEGRANAVLQLARYDPIDVSRFFDISPEDISGKVSGTIHVQIPFQRDTNIADLDWLVDLSYEELALAKPFDGQTVTDADGTIVVDPQKAVIRADAKLNGASATAHIVEPLGRDSEIRRERRIALNMDDATRNALAPGLDALLSGSVRVELDDAASGTRAIQANLDNALLNIPWVGWSKGSGVPASAAFNIETEGSRTAISNFRLNGDTFGATGTLALVGGEVSRVNLPSARLNRGDDFSVDVRSQGRGYAVSVRGKSVDARSVVKLYARDATGGTQGTVATPVSVDLSVDSMSGFHGEIMSDVTLRYSGTGASTDSLEFSAVTRSGHPVSFRDIRDGNLRTVTMNSSDAGALLRFLDIYEHMEGGAITLNLRGSGEGPLSGQIDARDFWLVNEPRMRSLVSTTPAGGQRSLNQAVRGDIDTTRVQFERAFSLIEKGTGSLRLERGVLRGPLIGSTFQGTLYDAAGNMDMTGTFMPAYGLNRIFGEIPLIGQLLGNGRDRGLIGITFKLAGKSGEPQLQINPLSVIAPGIFRSVFEYR